MTSEVLNTAARAVSQLATNGDRVKALMPKVADDFALGKDEASIDDAQESDGKESDGEEKILDDVGNDENDGATDQMPVDNDSDVDAEFKEADKEPKKRAAPSASESTAKAPKKPRAQRSKSDSQSRQQNKSAVKALKSSDDYSIAKITTIANTLGVVVGIDVLHDTPSSVFNTKSLWCQLVTLSSSTPQLPEFDFGQLAPSFSLQLALQHMIALETRLLTLVDRVVATDAEVGNFRDTFLRGAAWIKVVPPADDKDETPLRCEFLGASLRARDTSRVVITYDDKTTPPQTIIVATLVVNIVRSLIFKMRLAESLYAVALEVLPSKLRAKKFPADTTEAIALETVVSETGKASYPSKLRTEISQVINHLGGAPDKIDEAKKLILQTATAIEAAKSAPARVMFETATEQ